MSDTTSTKFRLDGRARRRRGVAIPGLIAFLLAPVASAGTYYASPDGDDRAKGTESAPWKTLLHAVNQLRPGDTLVVKPGSYESFYMRDRNSGTAQARVRVVAQEGAVIDKMLGRAQDGINVEYAKYITIEGFRVTNAPRAGIRAAECQHVHIIGNHTHDNGRWGIFTGFCDDLLIADNETSGSKREHGIYVSNSSKRPVIRGNHIHDNAMNGIHTNGDANMGRDGMTEGALIENNLIYNNGVKGGAALNNDGIQDSIIRNNIVFNNHANGITLYRIDGKRPSTNNKVINNTIINPSETRWCIHVHHGSTGNVFKNNICLSAHHYRGAIDIMPDSLSGFESDHNIIDDRFTLTDGNSVIRIDQWRQTTGNDKNSIPLAMTSLTDIFVDPARGDFRLKPGSPAIDKGDPAVAPQADYAGNKRAVGTAPDLGAIEYCEGKACVKTGGPAGPALLRSGKLEMPLVKPSSSGGGSSTGAGSGCCKGQVHGTSPQTSFVLALIVLLGLRHRSSR